MNIRIPPNDLQAEACVIGGAILSQKCIPAMNEILLQEDFYRPAHAIIWQTIREMFDQRQPIDLVTLRAALVAGGKIQAVGGIEYVVALLEGVPDASNATYYAEIVRDKAIRRKLISASGKLYADAYTENDNTSELMAEMSDTLYDITHRMSAQSHQSAIGPAASRVLKDAEEREMGGQLAGRWNSGFPSIDSCIHGLRAGHLTTLGGATGCGKTTLALCMAVNVAQAGGTVLYVSGEMLPDELAQRALQAHAKVSGNHIAEARITVQEWTRLDDACAKLRDLPVYIVGRGMGVSEISSKAREVRQLWTGNLAMIVVDYLQIMRLPAGREPVERLTSMTSELKRLAMETGACVLMLTQFSREEIKSGKPPTLYSGRGSGSIENDSNEVILLHDPKLPDAVIKSDGQKYIRVWGRIAKARDGQTTRWPEANDGGNSVTLLWQPPFTSFVDERMT